MGGRDSDGGWRDSDGGLRDSDGAAGLGWWGMTRMAGRDSDGGAPWARRGRRGPGR